MFRGSSGTMIRSMTRVMMARNSMKPLRSTPRGTMDRPMPRRKDSSRAVMTSRAGGIGTEK